MKLSKLIKKSLLGMSVILISFQVWAEESPKMKMTTETPPGIATPDKLDTHLGTLTSFDGVPDTRTTQLVYDNLDLQRATQAFLQSIQISSMYAMEQGILSKFDSANPIKRT